MERKRPNSINNTSKDNLKVRNHFQNPHKGLQVFAPLKVSNRMWKVGISHFLLCGRCFRSLPGLSVCRCRASSQRGLRASALNKALLTPVKNNDPAVFGSVLCPAAEPIVTESSVCRSAEAEGVHWCRCVAVAVWMATGESPTQVFPRLLIIERWMDELA